MFETIYTFLATIPSALIAAILLGGLRNISGWYQKVTAETSEGGKKISSYEWRQLSSTLVRYFTGIVGVTFMATSLGAGIPTEAIAGGVFGADVLSSWLNKFKNGA